MQDRTFLNVKHLAATDEAFLGITRTSVHDGRSEARRVLYRMVDFFFIVLGARVELVSSTAVPPSLGAGAGSAYISVEQTLRVSETGEVPAGEGDSSVRVLTRRVCLYAVAVMLLQAIVMLPYSSEAAVVDSVAKHLLRPWRRMIGLGARRRGRTLSGLLGPVIEPCCCQCPMVGHYCTRSSKR